MSPIDIVVKKKIIIAHFAISLNRYPDTEYLQWAS